jgi:hypothetical protein
MDTQMTPEQVALALATATRVNAPMIHASSFQAMFAGNDSFVVFSQPRLAVATSGEMMYTLEPVTIVQMSVSSLKDLALCLASQVEEYERRIGSLIVTDYMRRLEADRASAQLN